MISFIVDSTCDLPEDMMKEHGILIVPLHVLLNGNDYRNKVDITPNEVFAAMMKGQVPKTSGKKQKHVDRKNWGYHIYHLQNQQRAGQPYRYRRPGIVLL